MSTFDNSHPSGGAARALPTIEAVDVLLLIEHAARELDVACLLAHYFTRSSPYSFRIESLVFDLPRTLARYRPALVLVPYCYSASDWRIRNVVRTWPDAIYVNLACEQLFRAVQLHEKRPKDAFAKLRAIHHCWSRASATFLERGGVAPDRLFINGNLAYDLYSRAHRGLCLSKNELARADRLDPGKPWVLFTENYGDLFNKDTIISEFRRRGASAAEAEQRKDIIRRLFAETAHWLTRVPERFEVIVRPRPATSAERLERALREAAGPLRPNVHVIKTATARDWILASDMVLSSYSTTLIDAAVADKPGFMLVPVPLPSFMHADWHAHAAQIRTDAEFDRVVGEGPPRPPEDTLKDYVRHVMQPAHAPIARLATFLQECLQRPRPNPEDFPADLRQLDPWANDAGEDAAIVHEHHELDYLDPHYINDRIAQWAAHLGREEFRPTTERDGGSCSSTCGSALSRCEEGGRCR